MPDSIVPDPDSERESSTARIKIRLRQAFERNGMVFAKFMDPIAHALEMLPAEDEPIRAVGRKTRVLIVEDEDPIRRAYVRGLASEPDLELIPVSRVEDALSAIENFDAIDVVILDIYLTDGSGIDVAANLLEKWPWVKGVVISAYMSDSIQEKILSMVKPEHRKRWSFHAKPADETMNVILRAAGVTKKTPVRGITPVKGTPIKK
jgi:CheY-like chemotaxis protein